MSLLEVRTWLGGVPARVLSLGDAAAAGRRGTVLFFHGVTASKEVHDKELRSLAGRGFLAVGLDLVGHGERLHPRFAPHMPRMGRDYAEAFFAAVKASTLEVPRVVDALVAAGVADPGRIGAAGISMGGYVAYASPLAEHRVVAIAPLVARPTWWFDDPESPHRFPDAFYPVALLSQTGAEDRVVPPDDARAFHRELLPRYSAGPHRLEYHEYPGAGHAFPGEVWDLAWERLLAWFERFLRDEAVDRRG